MSGLRFLQPEAAYWLLAVPLVWCSWLLHRRYRDWRRRTSGIGPQLARLSPLTARKRDAAVLVLATTTVIALVFAAARPQAIVRAPQYESFDLIVLLDRSASMLATDVKPSRIARACAEIQNFLRTKPDAIDRVALVAFANTAVVTSHLTKDLDILFFFLDWISQDQNLYYGTNMGAALESALHIARRETSGRRQVVVLLSDGEERGERLDRAIEDLRASTIPIYAIGVGGDGAVTIPAPRGSSELTLRDDAGAELKTTFNEGTLRRIAAATGGSYFRSTSGLELAETLADVAAREKRPTAFRDEYRDIDGVALAAAAFTLAGLLVLL